MTIQELISILEKSPDQTRNVWLEDSKNNCFNTKYIKTSIDDNNDLQIYL